MGTFVGTALKSLVRSRSLGPAPGFKTSQGGNPDKFRVFGSIQRHPSVWLSAKDSELVNNFPSLNPVDKTPGPYARDELTGLFYTNIWSNYVVFASQTIPVLSDSSISTLNGTCGVPTNSYTNLIVDIYLPDPEGQSNGAQFNLPEFGGTTCWGFVQGKTYLGTFIDNGPFDANPAVGAFSFNIRSLGSLRESRSPRRSLTSPTRHPRLPGSPTAATAPP
jgi:hypothetical protein